MPTSTPFVAPAGPRPALVLSLVLDSRSPHGQTATLYAWGCWETAGHSDPAGMWCKTSARRRTYFCSAGVEHHSYWRRFHAGGNSPIDMRCGEHEVLFT